MKLYGYWRSSTAYRVRIALNLKGLEFENIPVHLVKDGGEHRKAPYTDLNPQKLVPFFIDNEVRISQSMAIIEYLEEQYPEQPLLPQSTADRATVRSIYNLLACDIHPIDNLRVLQYLTNTLGVSPQDRSVWYHHWILEGFEALENLLQAHAARGPFCLGVQPTMADVALIPQVYNAQRFEVDLSAFPRIVEVNDHCNSLQAFKDAAPDAQPDAS